MYPTWPPCTRFALHEFDVGDWKPVKAGGRTDYVPGSKVQGSTEPQNLRTLERWNQELWNPRLAAARLPRSGDLAGCPLGRLG